MLATAKEQRQETKDRFKKFRGISKKARISNKTDEENDIYTLDELMKLQSIRKIEILKMDIEGTEYVVLSDFLQRHQPAQVLLVGPQEVIFLLNPTDELTKSRVARMVPETTGENCIK
ncbi:hypothetical protein NECAME_03846 [Necator americanus]|uniref:Methyltransferase FkbM domain-containing protein n=1 Tax=Necator americanus TaxID=51031 RepID=W2SZP7_NECAM|nr:hypothetical protein NECAME_03846 [Necator americanus]ETN75123.1 hypothetical protein NECAME_03846 [Necator americanus]